MAIIQNKTILIQVTVEADMLILPVQITGEKLGLMIPTVKRLTYLIPSTTINTLYCMVNMIQPNVAGSVVAWNLVPILQL